MSKPMPVRTIIDGNGFLIVLGVVILLIVGFVVNHIANERDALAAENASRASVSSISVEMPDALTGTDHLPPALASDQPVFEPVETNLLPLMEFPYSDKDLRFLSRMGETNDNIVVRYAIGDYLVIQTWSVVEGLCAGVPADQIIDEMVHGNGLTVRRAHSDQTQIWKLFWLPADASALLEGAYLIYGCPEGKG